MILIAIANTLDFLERSMPELNELFDVDERPESINFKPYTKEELINIATSRLKNCKTTNQSIITKLIPLSVLNFTSMKISNEYGDVRKLLSTLEHSVEIAEREFFQTKSSIINCNDCDEDFIFKNIVPVSIQHVNKVIKSQSLDMKQFYSSTPSSRKGTPKKKFSNFNSTPSSLLKSKQVNRAVCSKIFNDGDNSSVSSITSLSKTPVANNPKK